MAACPVCQKPNPDAAVYCSSCGSELPRGGSTVRAAPLPDLLAQPQVVQGSLGVGRLGLGQIVDNKYRIEGVLGEGGMGVVYLARDVNTDGRVVVKAMRAEISHEDEFRERVRAEGRLLARIDHPNVVRLNAVVAEREALYLIMQYVEGQSLDKIINHRNEQRSPMPIDQTLSLFKQIVAGVGAAHAEGVVHRDIKPGNVLVRAKDGVAKVTDFGISKTEEDAKAGRGQTKGIIGSLWYMTPEQIVGRRDLDKRVDIYALGVMLFEMLTGHVPFDAQTDVAIMKQHLEAPFPSAQAERPDAPPGIDALLSRACAKDREGRFSSCEELAAALDALTAPPRALPSAPPRPGPPSQAPPPSSLPDPPAAGTPRVVDTTADATPLPDAPGDAPSGKGKVVAVVVVIAALAGAAVFGAYTALTPEPNTRPRPPASVRPSAQPSAPPPASASAPPARAPQLAQLAGRWKSDSGRHYQAELSGDSLEFRVIDRAHFEGYDYQVGEPRFTLRPGPGAGWFQVEDKFRPQAPLQGGKRIPFSERSRASCQQVFDKIDGAPLKATVDQAGKLSIDLILLTPPPSTFVIEHGAITGCQALDAARPKRIESTLVRAEP